MIERVTLVFTFITLLGFGASAYSSDRIVRCQTTAVDGPLPEHLLVELVKSPAGDLLGNLEGVDGPAEPQSVVMGEVQPLLEGGLEGIRQYSAPESIDFDLTLAKAMRPYEFSGGNSDFPMRLIEILGEETPAGRPTLGWVFEMMFPFACKKIN